MCSADNTLRDDRERLVHSALMYHGPDEYLDAAGGFVEAGLASGEPVLVAAPAATLDLLRGALGVAAAARVRFVDMGVVGLNPARILGLVGSWSEQHRGRVRVVEEPMWPQRTHYEATEVALHEALTNVALRDTEITMLCLYDGDALPAETVRWARQNHPLLTSPDGQRTASAEHGQQLDPLAVGRRPLDPPPESRAERRFAMGLRETRRFVAAEAGHAGLPADRVADFVFAMNEAVQNVLQHGGPAGIVKVWGNGGTVVGEVSGPGPAIDPLAGHFRPAPNACSGRGLWLINELSDLVQVRSADGWTTVRLRMNRRPPC
jgi:anti-sigma regulatory factor (Ser/Thr protein kinase)